MEAEYLAKGWTLTQHHSDADLIVVRGCSVTQRAQRDCEKFIAQLKERHPFTRIKICGCIESKSSQTAADINESAPSSSPPPVATPVRTARAYLKVQDGCSGKCSFCIVPKFRGKSVSIPFTDVIAKAQAFIEAGYREIVVTGCNLSLYASEGKRLAELIHSLASLTPSSSAERTRIRLGSVEPGSAALELVHAMAENENICRFLHIPVQSGSNKILTAMKRPYLAKDVDLLAQTALSLVPNIGLGCDFITGFPGETDVDFLATKSILKRHGFSTVHVFPYSERPGTSAATFTQQIDPDIRSQRARELSTIAESTRYAFARKFYGKTVEIVSEREGKCVGRTSEYLHCKAIGTEKRKDLVKIFITNIHHDGSLEGVIR